MHTTRHTLFIAIGTNLGERLENIFTAITRLAEFDIHVTKTSRVYETAPMYVEDQPRFLNMAIMAETALDAEDILKALKFLEDDIGRVKSIRNGPRLIDLDILYLDDQIIDEPHLQVPHVRIEERQFVLQPLLDLNADWLDARTGKIIKEMAQALAPDATLQPIGSNTPA